MAGEPGGRASRVVAVIGAAAAVLVALATTLLALAAQVSAPERVALLAFAALLVGVAVGLVRRKVLGAVLAVVLGSAGVALGLGGLLAVGDEAYDRLPQAFDLAVFGLLFLASAALVMGGAAVVPRRGSAARWVCAALLVAGLAVVGLGVQRLLSVQTLVNPTPGAANATLDCGSAYSPGSMVVAPTLAGLTAPTCDSVLDPARHDGRLMVVLGGTLALAAGALLVGQFGAGSWPFVLVAGGLVAGAIGAWLLFLPVQGSGCGSVSSGTEGDPSSCGSLYGALLATTRVLAVLAPVLVLAGVIGVVARAVGSWSGPRGRGGPVPRVSV